MSYYKTTAEQRKEIVRRYNTGERTTQIAHDFKISGPMVCKYAREANAPRRRAINGSYRDYAGFLEVTGDDEQTLNGALTRTGLRVVTLEAEISRLRDVLRIIGERAALGYASKKEIAQRARDALAKNSAPDAATGDQGSPPHRWESVRSSHDSPSIESIHDKSGME